MNTIQTFLRGQCEVEVTFFGDYYVYNIPYMDNTYVRVKVYDKNLEEQLEGKVDLIGKSVARKRCFYGMV